MNRAVTAAQASAGELHERIDAARLLRSLEEHPGWAAFVAEVDAKEQQIQTMLLRPGVASENAAEYASKLGEMRGLRGLPDLIEQAITRGENAAEMLRQRQNQPTAEEAA